MTEAPLEQTPAGLAPAGPGWFVVNAEDAPWMHTERFGSACGFEGRGDARFSELGFNVRVLQPGQAAGMYHAEGNQEAALVVSGQAILVVEGTERALNRWDFVHLPAGTPHAIVGAGDEPAVIVMAGTRGSAEMEYPVDPAALAHDAGVAEPTTKAADAYRGANPSFGPGKIPG
jgi:uncharacterized cupin superfamily protein